jgi:ATP-binding cassette subfamily B protein
MLVTNATEAFIPRVLERVVDLVTREAATPGAPDSLYSTLALLILVLVAQAFGRRYWRLSLGQETHRAAATLKEAVWLTARYFPRERLERDLSVGNLMNVATGDVATGRLIFGWTILGLLDFLFFTTAAFVSMVLLDPGIAALCGLAVALVPFATYRIAEAEYARHTTAQETLSGLNVLVTQAVSSIKVQRLSQSERFWTARLTALAEEYRRKRLAVVDLSLRFVPLTGLPPILCHLILCAVGIPAVFENRLSLGEFVAFQGYIVLLQGPFAQIGPLLSEWQRGRASLARVTAVLATPRAPGFEVSSPDPQPVPGTPVFSIRDLRFTHADAQRELFRGLTLEIAPGERIGITGPVGAGKTTFLEILAGHRREFNGEVRLHGVDIRRYSYPHLSREVTLVEQRPFLFADSIRRNVLLDRPGTDDAVRAWLDFAGLSDDIDRFPRGLDTPLGEWGINLSGGQKQRLTIARALATSPRILLLDDCLSAVDVTTEERILANLDRALPGATIVWVAHRPSTLRHCTRIVRFEP